MPGLLLQSNGDILQEFEELTKNAKAVQAATLARILQQNANTEYLLKHGLEGSTDAASFCSRLPLVQHGDIEPYIRRIAEGETSPILTASPIELFFLSSGTSRGRNKLIPGSEAFFYTTIRLFLISSAHRSRLFPIRPNKKVMDVVYCGKQFSTAGGIKAGTGTTNYYRSHVFELKQASTVAYNSSPHAVILCSDLRQAMYCHLLFGLVHSRDIEFISSVFVHSLLEAFRMFEQSWESLASDIEHGCLPGWITDADVCSYAASHLRPNASLARRIRSECEKGFEGIVGRIWTSAKYILSILTGTMVSYVPKMKYYAGTMPLVANDYGASESWVGINMDPLTSPEETSFTVVPDLAYFEFIPLSRHTNGLPGNEELIKSSSLFVEGCPVGLTDVKIGHEYEIVLTNPVGLYRYRLGDVVQITGFHNAAPQFRYVCRRDVLLSINIDKNGERDLELVMSKAAAVLQARDETEVADFTSYADATSTPGHYVLFVELNQQKGQDPAAAGVLDSESRSNMMQDFCNCLDKSFVEPGYLVSRAAKMLGPLELCIVESGTFSKLVDNLISRGGTFSQYKTPRCIAAPQLLGIMKQSTVEKYRSSS